MRRENSDFQTSYVSEAGSLKENKDYFGYVELDDYACFVVADGFDNDNQVSAAKMATDYILGNFTAHPGMSKRRMKRFLREANELLRRESVRVRLKCSIMIVITDYTKVRWAMAGNTRFYLFRSQKIFQKSKDQSFYQHDIDLGKIPDDGTREFEERHNLLQYVGQPRRLQPFVSKKYKLVDGDGMLICSSGFWEQLHNIEILDALDANDNSENFALDLQDMLLSKQKAGDYVGNFTVASIFVKKVFKKPDNRRKILKICLAIGIPLIIIGVVIGILLWRNNKKWVEQLDSVLALEQKADAYVNETDYDRAQSEYAKAVEAAAELKQTKNKKGKQNEAVKKRLADKERITQLLADGDQYIEDKSYSKALKAYQDAKKLLLSYTDNGEDINIDDVNIEDIDAQIARCQQLVDLEHQIKLADLQLAAGDYEEALDGYKKAHQEAIDRGESELEKDLAIKIAETQAKISGAKTDALKNEGMSLENAGDIAASGGDTTAAAGLYRQAAAAYAAAGYAEGVSSANGKIAQTEGKDAATVAAEQAQLKEEEAKAAEEEEKTKEEAEKLAEKAETDAEKNRINALKASAQKKEAEGDRCYRNGEYDKAYEAYEDAYDLYTEANMQAYAQLVARKMDKAVSAKENNESAEKALTAQQWETAADNAARDGEYDVAIAYYEMAQTMYREAGLTDKVLQMQNKIEDTKKLKQVAEQPTPSPTPEPTPEIIFVVPVK